MTTYYTSDTHFGHVNIISYCNRPFRDIHHMTEGLVRSWNEVVGPDDTVYHLGDFAMGPKTEHKKFFDRLNGYKVLIRGNHDQSVEKMSAMGWSEVHQNRLETIAGLRVYMAHVPPRTLDPYGDRFYRAEFTSEAPEHDIWLCGHVHDKFLRRGNVINVGVDVWGFKPRTFEELLAAVDSQPSGSVE